MRHGLRVKITNATIPSYWYATKLGQEFLVTHCMDSEKYILIQEYCKEQFTPHTQYIHMQDVVILQHFKYTTYFTSEIVLE